MKKLLFSLCVAAALPLFSDPVKDVFAGNIPSREEVRKDPARWQRDCFGMGGRAAWDETAVLAAVRGEPVPLRRLCVCNGLYHAAKRSAAGTVLPVTVSLRYLHVLC